MHDFFCSLLSTQRRCYRAFSKGALEKTGKQSGQMGFILGWASSMMVSAPLFCVFFCCLLFSLLTAGMTQTFGGLLSFFSCCPFFAERIFGASFAFSQGGTWGGFWWIATAEAYFRVCFVVYRYLNLVVSTPYIPFLPMGLGVK